MKTFRNIMMGLGMCSLLTVQSCYKDKGDYDYRDIGQVVVEQPMGVTESSVSQIVMQDDTLRVVPVLKITNIAEEDLEFLWDLAPANSKDPVFEELSREKVLEVVCKAAANKYDLRFRATDKHTGVSTYAYYNLVVNSVTTRCLLLLCKAGGNQFDISSCPIQPTRGEVGKDLYSTRNGSLLQDMHKLVYWNNIHGEQFLWGLQKNGGVTLSAFDLTYHGDAGEWFFEKPEVIRPTNIYGDVDGNDYFFLSDGGLYYLDNELAPPFKARMREKVSDDRGYEVEAAANVAVRKKRRYAFWDKLNGRFLQWSTVDQALTTFEAPDLQANPKSFDPNAMQGYTPLFLGDGIDKKSYNFFKGPDGQVHMFCFTGTGNNILPGEHRILDAAIGLDKADCIWAHRRFDMIYYAIDNVIYVFEPNSPIGAHRPVYTDPDNNMRFVEMFSYDSYETKLYVAGNSGSQGYVYRLYLDDSGDLTQPTEYQKEVVEKVGPFSEIVDMEYLLKDY